MLEPAALYEDRDLLRGYLPLQAWEHEPMTAGQQRYLDWLGADYIGGLTKGQASYAIEAILSGEPTWRQMAMLKRRGNWREGMTRREASQLCAEPGDVMTGW
jgi:hypothetical protein